MSKRTADSTIKGFLYQFNKTLLEISQAEEDETVTVEGLVEDLDIVSADGGFKAIQCKYHESQDKYTGSLIYKPLLQMAEAFSKSKSKEIQYIIFLHVPSEKVGERDVTKKLINDALATKDQLLKKITARISSDFDSTEFIKFVKIEFGSSIDDLEKEVKKALGDYELDGGDVETVLYPNAITKIAKLSSLKNEAKRKITRKELSRYLSSVTTTAISKWTLALRNRTEILNKNKKQLANSLSQNSRERYFYFTTHDIENFDKNIVVFICNYLGKYHSKTAHLKTPVFAIDRDLEVVKEIQYRLFKKGIKTNTGLVGDHFEIEQFYREPIKKIAKGVIEEREFDLRLLALKPQPDIINNRKGDDLYLVCNCAPDYIDTTDINCYQVGTENFNELEYVINLRNSHE